MARIAVIMGINKQCETTLRLNNGDLVIIGDDIHMVTSYTSYSWEKKSGNLDKRPEDYCALVNIENGMKMFPEPCSRRTTRARVLSHLNNKYPTLTDTGFIIVPSLQYTLTINLVDDYTTK